MVTEEIVVNGKKETIVVKLPEDEYEDYIDINVDDTMDISEIIEEISNNE